MRKALATIAALSLVVLLPWLSETADSAKPAAAPATAASDHARCTDPMGARSSAPRRDRCLCDAEQENRWNRCSPSSANSPRGIYRPPVQPTPPSSPI